MVYIKNSSLIEINETNIFLCQHTTTSYELTQTSVLIFWQVRIYKLKACDIFNI